jgi:hypothetical protein
MIAGSSAAPGDWARLWAVDIKTGLTPHLERGFHHTYEGLQPARAFVVYQGRERYPLTPNVQTIGLPGLAGMLVQLGR